MSRERPSKKRPELWRKCEAASQPWAAFMFTNLSLFLPRCASNFLGYTSAELFQELLGVSEITSAHVFIFWTRFILKLLSQSTCIKNSLLQSFSTNTYSKPRVSVESWEVRYFVHIWHSRSSGLVGVSAFQEFSRMSVTEQLTAFLITFLRLYVARTDDKACLYGRQIETIY